MTNNFPWERLDQPTEGNLTRRRVFENSSCNIFIAQDFKKDYQLIFELSRPYQYLLKGVNISSLNIALFQQTNQSFLLSVKLNDKNSLAIFDYIVYAILIELIDQKDEEKLITCFLKNLKEWQKFLQPIQHGMSEEKIRGLLAELYFMLQLLNENRKKADRIISAWCGPSKLQQDFIFEDVAIEVKSIGNTDKQIVSISSINQLQSNVNDLYLSVFKILKVNQPEGMEVYSLNGLVEELSNLLQSNERIALRYKLLEAGSMRDEQYNHPLYHVQLVNHYKVDENFPKLTSKAIPDGVINVKYDIDLNKISNFKISIDYSKI